MSPEQIAKDVAERYGVPVREGAVQICPPHTPALNEIDPPSYRELTDRQWRNLFRRKKFERGDRKAGRLNETDAKIARLRSLGMTLQAIADEVGVSMTTVHVRLSMMPKVTA